MASIDRQSLMIAEGVALLRVRVAGRLVVGDRPQDDVLPRNLVEGGKGRVDERVGRE